MSIHTHIWRVYMYIIHTIYWKRRNTNTDHHFTILSMCILNRNVMMWNPHHNTDQPESNPPITELWSLFLCLFLYLFLWNLCPFLFCHLHWWSFTGVDIYIFYVKIIEWFGWGSPCWVGRNLKETKGQVMSSLLHSSEKNTFFRRHCTWSP